MTGALGDLAQAAGTSLGIGEHIKNLHIQDHALVIEDEATDLVLVLEIDIASWKSMWFMWSW